MHNKVHLLTLTAAAKTNMYNVTHGAEVEQCCNVLDNTQPQFASYSHIVSLFLMKTSEIIYQSFSSCSGLAEIRQMLIKHV